MFLDDSLDFLDHSDELFLGDLEQEGALALRSEPSVSRVVSVTECSLTQDPTHDVA